MESVIKRLTTEYKLAQQQSQELQRSAQFLDSILHSTQPPTDAIPPTGISTDSKKGSAALREIPLKPRFCDPPNPPPQAPLPEKPTEPPGSATFLKRAETEKPKLPNGPASGSIRLDGSTASQIQSLTEALAAAKEDLQNQSQRLRDMENLLVEERVKREDAEARAKKLEQTNNPNTPQKTDGEGPSTPIEDEASSEIGPRVSGQTATEQLQRRLETLLIELQEIKAESDKWRREKEEVEKERDVERKEKVGLLEMVEKLRNEEKERMKKRDRKRDNRKPFDKSAEQNDRSINDNDTIDREDDETKDSPERSAETLTSKPAVFSNGHLSQLLHPPVTEVSTATRHSQGQLVQAAPYLSAMSVVLIGVAVMALVNKMSRGER